MNASLPPSTYREHRTHAFTPTIAWSFACRLLMLRKCKRLGGTHDMTRGPDGLWTVTIPPQVVGFHYYSIVVDGALMADPATRTFFGSGWDNSGIEIAAQDVDNLSAVKPGADDSLYTALNVKTAPWPVCPWVAHKRSKPFSTVSTSLHIWEGSVAAVRVGTSVLTPRQAAAEPSLMPPLHSIAKSSYCSWVSVRRKDQERRTSATP